MSTCIHYYCRSDFVLHFWYVNLNVYPCLVVLGLHFGCRGSLLGPYFIQIWVPIRSLYLSWQVPVCFRHSANAKSLFLSKFLSGGQWWRWPSIWYLRVSFELFRLVVVMYLGSEAMLAKKCDLHVCMSNFYWHTDMQSHCLVYRQAALNIPFRNLASGTYKVL